MSKSMGTPEEDLRILREMLVPEMILEPDTGTDGKPRIKLTDPDNPNTCVTITGLLPHTIAVKSDAVPCTGRCFQSSRGEAKRSDYILICAGEKERWVVFIELKGSMKYASLHGVASQLLGSRCFFEYVRFTGRMFWECPDFLSAYAERYVVFPRSSRRSEGCSDMRCMEALGVIEVRRIGERMGVRFRRMV
ncbi:hypothetical protein [Methanorbis rubei]|uniref:Uncharacterized protein n=1 Tax=Methanorbis rubei TaxID=3028300 RepID=A0AAE4MEF8_9EURY|nr:hypothetical protein [Methanocorpusculaceae archaeon Cs1]